MSEWRPARRGRKATMTRRIRRLGLVVAVAAGSVAMLGPGPATALPAGAPKIGMVCTPGTVAGSTHTFNLVANTGYIQTPDGNAVFMWSYANADAPDNGTFQSPGPNYAYNSAATQFDPAHEFLMLFNEIDPDLHHAVETGGQYDFNALHNRYFAINGREFPDTVQDNSSALLPSQPYGALVRIQPTTVTNPLPSLIRMINAGANNHPFHPHGNHTTEIAQDGRLVAPTEHFGETIGSGQTIDYLLRWNDADMWNPASNPLPVAPPNYRNVTFKDANTYYGGSPYLGYTGTLPAGTVTQNICGEWYFPLHSHALNEFTNFDQGFGGMGTLLRVDPPGGCFGAPLSAALMGGNLKGGSVSA